MHATKFPANVVMARRPRRRRGVRCPAASSTGWESEDGSGSREDDECGGALIYYNRFAALSSVEPAPGAQRDPRIQALPRPPFQATSRKPNKRSTVAKTSLERRETMFLNHNTLQNAHTKPRTPQSPFTFKCSPPRSPSFRIEAAIRKSEMPSAISQIGDDKKLSDEVVETNPSTNTELARLGPPPVPLVIGHSTPESPSFHSERAIDKQELASLVSESKNAYQSATDVEDTRSFALAITTPTRVPPSMPHPVLTLIAPPQLLPVTTSILPPQLPHLVFPPSFHCPTKGWPEITSSPPAPTTRDRNSRFFPSTSRTSLPTPPNSPSLPPQKDISSVWVKPHKSSPPPPLHLTDTAISALESMGTLEPTRGNEKEKWSRWSKDMSRLRLKSAGFVEKTEDEGYGSGNSGVGGREFGVGNGGWADDWEIVDA